jgi:hypothetical protein
MFDELTINRGVLVREGPFFLSLCIIARFSVAVIADKETL